MRVALIVGIDDYELKPIKGNVNNASMISKVLAKNWDGSPNFDCKNIISSNNKVTLKLLEENIQILFDMASDLCVLYFSGYGKSSLNGYITSQDQENILIEKILSLANASPSKEIVIILDLVKNVEKCLPERTNEIFTRKGITILAAGNNLDSKLDTFGLSVLTPLVYEALLGNASDLIGRVTIASIFSYVDNTLSAWDQRPLFKSFVSSLSSIRRCNPKINIDILTRIPLLFPDPLRQFFLDPSYEVTSEPRDEKKETIFKELSRLSTVGLVEPVGEDHMYFAAVNTKSCRLTSLGQYYWQIVKQNRI